MRLLFLVKLAAVACIATIATGQASACQCGPSIYGKNSWEVAKLEAKGAIVVFEGTREHFEMQWSLLNAKEGELIPPDTLGATRNNRAGILLTFRVQRAYQGDLGPEVQLSTGLGGGDCGAQFVPGLTYLVCAYGPTLGELGVSMCSPGRWIGDSSVAADLRYLRHERPSASDLVPSRRLTAKEQKEQRQRYFEEFKKRYAAVTGKIRGTVIAGNTRDANAGAISFLSTAGYSPVEHPITQVDQDGSFCSGRLGPSKYYLYFTRASDAGLTSAVYYPGVNDRIKATAIEISAGQTQSNITFNVPVQKTYSVRGFISTNDKSELDANSISVVLVGLDGALYPGWYSPTIDFQGSSPLPKVRYFNFENVLPGRYIAYASVVGRGWWYTKKVEVIAMTHMKFISLQLVHKK